MATHPIGPGTCNLSINVKTHVRSSVGRAAFLENISMGELVRRILARAGFVCGAAKFALTAEESDMQAIAILRAAMSDGITEADRPAIERAIALISRSAATDAKLASNLDIKEAL